MEEPWRLLRRVTGKNFERVGDETICVPARGDEQDALHDREAPATMTKRTRRPTRSMILPSSRNQFGSLLVRFVISSVLSKSVSVISGI